MIEQRYGFPAEIGLGRFEAPLAYLLVTREEVSALSAFEFLYSGRYPQPNFGTLKVHIHHLRKKLGRLGIKVQTIWGWGWKMPAGDRAKLRALMSPSAEGNQKPKVR